MAIAALAILTVVAFVAAAFAFVQYREAIRQRNRAIAKLLTSEGASMLAGVQAGGDARAVKQILAASHITSTADGVRCSPLW